MDIREGMYIQLQGDLHVENEGNPPQHFNAGQRMELVEHSAPDKWTCRVNESVFTLPMNDVVSLAEADPALDKTATRFSFTIDLNHGPDKNLPPMTFVGTHADAKNVMDTMLEHSFAVRWEKGSEGAFPMPDAPAMSAEG